MFKVVMLLIFFLSSNIFAMKDQEAAEDENPKPVRIAFFIDDHSERFGSGKRGAITGEFARTISKKASHVTIVSNYVLKNMILRKYTENPDPFLNSLFLDLNDWDIYQVNNTQFFVFVPQNYDNPIFNKTLWTKINLSTGNEYNGEGNQDFPIIPWAKDTPVEAKRLLSNGNIKYITYAKDSSTDVKDMGEQEIAIHKKFEPSQLSLIFKPIEDYEKLSLSQSCNIFINGHGSYSPGKKEGELYVEPEKFTVAGMSVKDMTNTLLFFNDKLNTKSVRLLSCYSGGKILDLIRTKNYVPIRMKYLFLVDSITDAPSFGFFPSKPTVYMGLDLKGYFEALDNFQKSHISFRQKIGALKDKHLQKITQTMPKAEKEEIKKAMYLETKEILNQTPGFNAVLQKLSLPGIWYLLPDGLNNFPQICIPEVGWFQTFDINPDIQKITDATMIKALAKPEFIKNEEVEIEDVRESPPQIKKVIIKSRLKKMNFAKAGTVDINNKLALLLYSEIISANLNIIPNSELHSETLYASNTTRWLLNLYKYFPSIPCIDTVYTAKPVKKNLYVYPQFVSMQKGDSLNLFAKINIPNTGEPSTETGILNFLRDSFLILRDRKSEKTFFIKELEGFNDFSQILDDKDEFKKFLKKKKLEKKQIILQNVFIRTSRVKTKKKSHEFLTLINISFNFDGKSWDLSYITKNLNLEWAKLPADKSQSLWCFKEAAVIHNEHLKSSNLTYLAQLPPAEYYKQLPIIRDIFQHLNTSIKIKNPSRSLSFKDFIALLDIEDIKKAIKKGPGQTKRINVKGVGGMLPFQYFSGDFWLDEVKDASDITQREWESFEHQTQLKLSLKKLKNSLVLLKQKLLILSSKLELLNKQLTGAV